MRGHFRNIEHACRINYRHLLNRLLRQSLPAQDRKKTLDNVGIPFSAVRPQVCLQANVAAEHDLPQVPLKANPSPTSQVAATFGVSTLAKL